MLKDFQHIKLCYAHLPKLIAHITAVNPAQVSDWSLIINCIEYLIFNILGWTGHPTELFWFLLRINPLLGCRFCGLIKSMIKFHSFIHHIVFLLNSSIIVTREGIF